MQQLETISIERQSHPDLSTEQPFSIVGEYCRGPRTEFHGDMHYALQICIVLTGGLEILFEDFQRVYGPYGPPRLYGKLQIRRFQHGRAGRRRDGPL